MNKELQCRYVLQESHQYSPVRNPVALLIPSKIFSASATKQFCAGQCNDAFFKLSKEKGITFVLDTPIALSERGVVCKSGKVMLADIIVNASGCKFMARPDFLQSLDLGNIHIVVHILHFICPLHALHLFPYTYGQALGGANCDIYGCDFTFINATACS